MGKIEVGSQVPEFVLPDQNGELFNIKDYIGKNSLVIYFYPKDDTPACTKEACYFRDQYEVFSDNGAMIIGISSQSSESHKNFIEKYRLPFTLLSDKEHKAHRMFGVSKNPFLLPSRITFIINKAGKIVFSFDSQVNVISHIDEALRIIKELRMAENENL
jgi:thioredoxin-dependent peroxiredoxin